MTARTGRAELSEAELRHLKQGADRLRRRFEGQLNAETIERFLHESLDTLLERARMTEWVPLLAERFAADRIRATIRLEGSETSLNPSILFLCVHNAGRSQMAAGFARTLSAGGVDVFSGGSEPADQINQTAVAAMAEVGIDISEEVPLPWSDEVVRAADVVVTMGCGDACPIIPGKRYIDWEVEDPAGKPIEEVRSIRDDLEARVRALLAELKVPV